MHWDQFTRINPTPALHPIPQDGTSYGTGYSAGGVDMEPFAMTACPVYIIVLQGLQYYIQYSILYYVQYYIQFYIQYYVQ